MIITLQTLIYFRESLVTILDRLIGPYYKRFRFSLKNNDTNLDEDDSEDEVFATFDDEKGVIFFPPMYAQRYAAVNDCLLDERWCGQLEKIVDLGYHDTSFIKYLKEVPEIKHILGVDTESVPLRCSSDLIAYGDYIPKRESPLRITGNAADPDYRLIGCDAVVAIEMIEHMLPHDLDRLVHNIFGFIQPHIAVITTPNADFNTLFKAMEKNGLRRLDHFFEWTREQFYDWCSNIVLRYPNYTVTCKGIGPGPPGTSHVGCCSQLALFISKDYHKQQDLTIDSLALVKNLPKDIYNLSDMEGSWECVDDISEGNMICGPSNAGSELFYTEKQSLMKLVIKPFYPLYIPEYKNSTIQCNMDSEVSRSYLMFDEDVSANVLKPQRQIINKIYDMEDVNNRLNCSTFQVKKFTQASQNLIVKNKTDSFIYTKELVNDIRHLRKMLNFDKEKVDHKHSIWRNINWGDDAPYWNQYYKVVRDYNYPFEIKSDECRILELISDEINQLIDAQCTDDGISTQKLEIPIDNLMVLVKHITDDKHKVKDLLEWNGYKVANDIVIHSRLVGENLSMATPEIEWQDNDASSNWDGTELHSIYSNRSIVSTQLVGKGLQSALEYKVRNLRALLNADEDITTELDHVACRLIRLALRASRDRNAPPPATWLQCKLLDLLTLTERAIERRKRDHFDKNPLTIQSTDFQVKQNKSKLLQAEEDSETMKEIVDKYCHFIDTTENTNHIDDFIDESSLHTKNEEELSVTSNELVKIFDYNDETSSSVTRSIKNKKIKIRTREKKSAIRARGKLDSYSGVSSSGDTDHSINICRRNTSKNTNKKDKIIVNKDSYRKSVVRAKSKRLNNRDNKINEKYGGRDSKKGFFKRIIGKKNLYSYLLNNNVSSIEYGHYRVGIKKSKNRQYRLFRSLSKPIPTNLLNPRQQEDNIKVPLNTLKFDFINCDNILPIHNQESIAITEESCVLEIVTDGTNETIALRRTIATEAYDCNFDINEKSPPSYEMTVGKDLIASENMESKHTFLFDISEPSTSKGIRHVKMDVQCGSDAILSPVLSPTMSLHRVPGILTKEYDNEYASKRIPCKQYLEYSHPTDHNSPIDDEIRNYRLKSNGIQIRDSPTKMLQLNESGLADINHNENSKEAGNSTPNNVTDGDEPYQTYNVMETNEQEFDLVKSSSCDKHNVPLNKISTDKTKSISGDIMPAENKENILRSYIPVSKGSVKSELTCGGIFIHSYKDRRACEDISYQGKWQHSAHTVMHRNPRSTITIRKNPQQRISTNKNYNNKKLVQMSSEKIHVTSQNYIRCKRKIDNEKLKGQNFISHIINRPVQSSTPIKRTDKQILKAVSETSPSRVLCENIKNEHTTLTKLDKTLTSEKSNREKKIKVHLRKDFIPQYLLSRKPKSLSKSIEKIVDPYLGVCKSGITKNNIVTISRTKNVKKDFLKHICDAPRVTYSVFRNKIENKKGSDREGSLIKTFNNNNENEIIQSANSSCSITSSNNSIATIKEPSPLDRKPQSKENFTSKSTLRSNNAIESFSLSKTEENYKKSTVKFDDKENKPGRSNSYIKLDKAMSQDPTKSILVPRNNFYNDNNILSNVGIEGRKDVTKNLSLSSVSLRKKRGVSDSMPYVISSPQSCLKLETPHKVVILEHNGRQPSTASAPTSELSQEENQGIISKVEALALKDTKRREIENYSVNVYDQMLTIVEEILGGIQYQFRTKSPDSTNHRDTTQGCNLISDKPLVEDSVASSFGSGPRPINLDLISFKSFASISGYSEYFLADNDLNSTLDSLQILSPPERSWHDIFERKDQLRIPNSGSLMDAQSYGGFSINERMIGDQPDYVNFIDSETGSVAHCLEVRRATSEEVFTSGRSSDTYVSCQVEDDTMVPHWLFRTVNHHSDEDAPLPVMSPVPLPTVSPQLDVNGNISEAGLGVGGAGDGRGIHSDLNSSGRDTSMSSTDTSSGQHSEALLTEPSTLTGNNEFLESSRPFLQIPSTGLPSASYQAVEGAENENAYNVSEGSDRNAINHETIASDRDADVSSLDTDIADFSDN